MKNYKDLEKDGLILPGMDMLQALKEIEDIKNNPDKYKGYNDVDEFISDVLSED